MCCNGVLFYGVTLQPADSAKTLAGLGLRLKQKRRQTLFLQPCPAHRSGSCAIYEHRPERCRKFSCRQLEKMEAGAISFPAAEAKVSTALAGVARVQALLAAAGEKNLRRSLAVRCAGVLERRPDAEEKEFPQLQDNLRRAMADLEDLLEKDFRTAPPSAPKPGFAIEEKTAAS